MSFHDKFPHLSASPHSFRLTYDGRVLGDKETVGSLLPSSFNAFSFIRPKLVLFMSVDFRSFANQQRTHSQLAALADLSVRQHADVFNDYASETRKNIANVMKPTQSMSSNSLSTLPAHNAQSTIASRTSPRSLDVSMLPPAVAARVASMNRFSPSLSPIDSNISHTSRPLKPLSRNTALPPNVFPGIPPHIPERGLNFGEISPSQGFLRNRSRKDRRVTGIPPALTASHNNRIFHHRPTPENRPGNDGPGNTPSNVYTGVVMIQTDQANTALHLPPGVKIPIEIPAECILLDGQGDIPEETPTQPESSEHPENPSSPPKSRSRPRGPTEVDGLKGSVVGTIIIGEAALKVSAAMGVSSAAVTPNMEALEEFVNERISGNAENPAENAPTPVELSQLRGEELLFASMQGEHITFAPLPEPIIAVPQRDRWVVSKRIAMLLALITLHHADLVWGHKWMVFAGLVSVLFIEWLANTTFDWVYRRIRKIQQSRAQAAPQAQADNVANAADANAAAAPPNQPGNDDANPVIGPTLPITRQPPRGVIGAVWWFTMGLVCSVLPAWRHPVVPMQADVAGDAVTGGAAMVVETRGDGIDESGHREEARESRGEAGDGLGGAGDVNGVSVSERDESRQNDRDEQVQSEGFSNATGNETVPNANNVEGTNAMDIGSNHGHAERHVDQHTSALADEFIEANTISDRGGEYDDDNDMDDDGFWRAAQQNSTE